MRLVCLAALVWFFTQPGLAQSAEYGLPKPHYHSQLGEPPWLARLAELHGHLGPWAVSGCRLGTVGLRRVGAVGYFDVEVTCEGPLAKPPRSCFLDGLQVGTGATLGKRNLHWQEANELVVRVRNVRTGQVAEVRPTAQLHALLSSVQLQPRAAGSKPPDDRRARATQSSKEDPAEVVARRIAAMSDEQICTVKVSSQ